MQLNELLERVHAAYPDEQTRDYWDPEQQRACAGSCDTLAEFIVKELADTYDETASDEEQIDEAIRVLRRACEQVANVVRALQVFPINA